MSNIDKQALREEFQFMRSIYSDPADHERQLIYIAAEALLDELEAKDNRINRLEAIVAVAEQRNALMREWKRALKVPCDLVDDQVPVVIHGMVIRLERLKETEDKLTAAEKRIADQRGIIASARKFISEYAGLGDVGAAEFVKIIDRAAAAGKGD
ncbi:hypothetical protein [Enterobacter hormaechei]|uniref:hypothetical protein n=1 Tax=Enterobacter hormaechei TaxID=158836 RepID=UPI0031DF6821